MINLTGFITLFAYVSLASVLMIILSPTPLHMVFFGLSFYVSFGWLFILLGYDFLGIVLIILYAGALMVSFLFVVMVFDLARPSAALRYDSTYWWRLFLVLGASGCGLFSTRGLILFSGATDALRLLWQVPFGFPLPPSLPPSSFSSVLSGLATVFYHANPLVLFSCGIALVVGLVGAIGLACGSPLLPLRQRVLSTSRSSLATSRVIILC